MNKLEILFLEDQENDAKLIEHALREGGIAFTARRVDTRDEFLRALKQQAPDVILADCKLPHFDGREALKLARERLPATPVIMVTGALGDEDAVALLHEGAADYILKDRLSRLAPAVSRVLKEAQAEASRREAQERYRALFQHAADGIVLVDRETEAIVDANPEFERQAGRPLDELRRLKFWQLHPATQRPAGESVFREILGKAPPQPAAITLQKPDGTRTPVEMHLTLIEIGGRSYLQGIGRDITERLAAEHELHAQLDELQRFQKVAVDRELRLQELEERLAKLEAAPARAG